MQCNAKTKQKQKQKTKNKNKNKKQKTKKTADTTSKKELHNFYAPNIEEPLSFHVDRGRDREPAIVGALVVGLHTICK